MIQIESRFPNFLGKTALRASWMAAALVVSVGVASAKTNSVYVTNNCAANLGESANANACNVSEYNITSSNGVLTAIKGSPVAALPDSQPEGIAVTPNGKFAYVVGFNSNTITGYRRSAGGTLLPIPNGVVYTDGFGGGCPDEAAIDPTGHFLYVTDECNPFIYEYSINIKTGALTALPIPPFTNGAVNITDGIVIDSAGGFVYATDPGNADVIEMSIDTTGTSCGAPGCLKFIGTAFDSLGNFSNPVGITVDPSGKFLYVADDRAAMLSSFAINPDGTLTALDDTTTNLASPENVVVEPSDKFVYVADLGNLSRGTSGGDIAVFEIDKTTATCGAPGCVFPVTTVSPPNRGCPFDLAIDPTGKFVYASEICFNNVLEYSIDLADCTAPSLMCLKAIGTGVIPAGVEPRGIAIGDPPRKKHHHH